MASTLNAKQMRQLLQSISSDPQLKQSKDSINEYSSGQDKQNGEQAYHVRW